VCYTSASSNEVKRFAPAAQAKARLSWVSHKMMGGRIHGLR
jgi:hypothetical protein